MPAEARKYPTTLKKSPAIDVIIELRFDSALPSEVIVGSLWNALKNQSVGEEYKIEKLPLASLPDNIRDSDPNLRFQPHFKMQSPKTIIQIGQRSLGIAPNGKYLNWADFKGKFGSVLSAFQTCGISSNFTRIGIRYVNFVDMNIFPMLNYRVNYEDAAVRSDATNLRLQLSDEGNVVILNIMNAATITGSISVELIGKIGSVIDIDSSRENLITFSQIDDVIESVHRSAKNVFFGALKNDLIELLEPVYQEQ